MFEKVLVSMDLSPATEALVSALPHTWPEDPLK